MATTLKFTLSLNTPAFLGRADQTAEWRTPPLKALLRQMYRLAHARSVQYDHARLAADEGSLFGQAAGNHGTRSRIILRLAEAWAAGAIRAWPNAWRRPVRHPEVHIRQHANARQNAPRRAEAPASPPADNQAPNIDAMLYLGYGPLSDQRNQTRLGSVRRPCTALDPANQSASLLVSLPTDIENERQDILLALRLMHLLGTIGGRSRNGWGSLHMEALEGWPDNEGWPTTVITDQGLLTDQARATLNSIARDWTACLDYAWPHAVGSRENGNLLVWVTTAPYESWQSALEELARVKIALRTQFRLGGNDERIPRRCVLAYPITHHGTDGWPRELRMPNQLRFKVVKQPDGKLRGLIFHIPWRPDERRLSPPVKIRLAEEVWSSVHRVLDERCQRA